jgi:hypothetical protein
MKHIEFLQTCVQCCLPCVLLTVTGNTTRCLCSGLAVCPPILQLVLLPWCPESPRYLLITKQWEEEARRGECNTARASCVLSWFFLFSVSRKLLLIKNSHLIFNNTVIMGKFVHLSTVSSWYCSSAFQQ